MVLPHQVTKHQKAKKQLLGIKARVVVDQISMQLTTLAFSSILYAIFHHCRPIVPHSFDLKVKFKTRLVCPTTPRVCFF
jgi:hypothetical protein